MKQESLPQPKNYNDFITPPDGIYTGIIGYTGTAYAAFVDFGMHGKYIRDHYNVVCSNVDTFPNGTSGTPSVTRWYGGDTSSYFILLVEASFITQSMLNTMCKVSLSFTPK